MAARGNNLIKSFLPSPGVSLVGHQPGFELVVFQPSPAQFTSLWPRREQEAEHFSLRLSTSLCPFLAFFSAVSLRNKVCSRVILTRLKNLLLQAALSLSVVLGLLSRGRRDHNAQGTQKQPEPHFSDRQQGEESQILPPCLIFFSPSSLLVLKLGAKL